MHIGKSVVYLGIANFIFYLTGYLTYLILGRVLGPAAFGIYGVIISLTTVVNITIARGISSAASKFISERVEKAEVIKRELFWYQFLISIFIFGFFFLFAKQVALLFNDANLTKYIRIVSFAFISFPLYGVFTGYINGLKRFKQQSILHILYSVLKMVLMIGLVLLGFSVAGAFVGFVFASLILLLLSLFIYGVGEKGDYISFKKILNFAMPITVLNLFILLLPEISLYLIKSLSELNISNTLAGYYTAVLTIAKIPIYLLWPLSLVLFPMISESTSFKDIKTTRDYIKSGLRYSLMIIVPLAFLISATSKAVISLLYSRTFVTDINVAPSLSILIIGLSFFALFSLLTTVISGSGKPKISMMIGGLILISNIILNYIFIPGKGLIGAALATSVSVLMGFIISGIYIIHKFKVFVCKKSVIRIGVSGLVIYFIAKNFLLVGGILLIVKYLIIIGLYVLLLIILKELKKKDIIFFRRSLF